MRLLKLRLPDIALFGTYMLPRGAALHPAPSVAPHNLASNLLRLLSQHCNKGKIMNSGLTEIFLGVTAGAFGPVALMAAWEMLRSTKNKQAD